MERAIRKVKKEKCSECGHSATVTRGDYRFDDMGVPLILGNIEIIKCGECNTTEPVIPNMNELMDVLALAVICQPCKLRGNELRFVRMYLGRSAKEFSALVHLDPTTLSKMENGEREIGKQTDKFVRLLALNLSENLKGHVAKLIKLMPDIDDESCDEPKIRIDPSSLQYQYA